MFHAMLQADPRIQIKMISIRFKLALKLRGREMPGLLHLQDAGAV